MQFGNTTTILSYFCKEIQIYKPQDNLNHGDFCKLMNESIIYIGNNLSDGMPNTLLEAIIFGAFPIQSNPGGASAEIIDDGINGLLIKDCEDVLEIKATIEEALYNKDLLEGAFIKNMKLREKLDYNFIRTQVLDKYEMIEKEILKERIHLG